MAHDLVIFDCDGVLIDSEMLTVKVEVALLAEAGIAISGDEILARYCGISMKSMLADLETRFARPLGDNFAARHAVELAALCQTELQAMPEVEAVLDALTGKICVASSSSPERLRHTLGLVDLYRRFDPHVFSATMVERGKPAPDLFLYAARNMGVEPTRCVVVEDSLPGVAAARAAGMAVVGFAGGSHCAADHAQRLTAAGASAVVAHMRDLPPALLAGAAPGRLR
ncbi:MAG: HAD-IA family hydrolase [Alphaproteobacteria bacterium]|nr:HAD-IA family hydrolase [Alphaproteobacteria bacterium]MBV9554338.1 HAD-IA family hydrolase [Alphaproteobacteria bacterium]